jgi:hypothetical protein
LSGDPLVKDHRGLRRRPLYSPILLVAASLVAAAVILGWLAASWGTTTVILTRHAARAEGEDPALTEVGKARARSLSAMLADAGVDAIFVSEYRRTRQTAEPVAAAAGLTPVVVPAGDLDQLEEMLKEHHSGEVVLVVGHSNTGSVLDPHPAPEGNPAFQVLRAGNRVRIMPGGIEVAGAVDNHVVIPRRAFPAADGAQIAGLEPVGIHGAGGEVVVAFDNDGVFALGDHGAVPDGSGQEGFLRGITSLEVSSHRG